ncbi:hypothetical protein SDC9_198555 [bioreactor metagenome]|uniref:Type II secretion system protein G n=1 Tax=bioreactor metagenome TaxID=1076179 RepID=A0A645II07_9ZZZZ
MRISNKKGFTLIELVVVLAILAVLAAIIVPTTFSSIEKARQTADVANLDALNAAVRMEKIIDQTTNPVTYVTAKAAFHNAGIDALPTIQSNQYKGFGWDATNHVVILVTDAANSVAYADFTGTIG